MIEDYEAYIEKLSFENLVDIEHSINREKFPERYEMVVKKLKEFESNNSNTSEQNIINNHGDKEFASILTRFGAIVLDSLILIPIMIPFYIFDHFTSSNTEPSALYITIYAISLISLIGFSIWNSVIRMGRTGQSLGRKFLNIAVLKMDGTPIGIGNSFLREYIGRWLSSFLYLGYISAFWDNEKQMWHDKIAKCYVYYVDTNFS